MNRRFFSLGAFALAAHLILGPSVTLAAPARNANIWDWRDHEPVPSQVQNDERAAGIGLFPQQEQAEDRELQSICRELIKGPCPDLSRTTNGNG
jgi:hypothetical protein